MINTVLGWDVGALSPLRLALVALGGVVAFFAGLFLPFSGASGMTLRWLLTLALAVLVYRLVTAGSGHDWGLRLPAWRPALGWLVAGVLATHLLVVISYVSRGGPVLLDATNNAYFAAQSGMLQSTLDQATGQSVPLGPPYQVVPSGELAASLIAIALFAGLVEEIAFRGLIFRGLRDALVTRTSRWTAFAIAAALQAALFVGIHPADLWSGVVTGFIAVFWAFVYEKTGSLLIPILGHALYNDSQVLIALYGPHAPAAFPVFGLMLLIVAPFLACGIAWLIGRLLGTGTRIQVPFGQRLRDGAVQRRAVQGE